MSKKKHYQINWKLIKQDLKTAAIIGSGLLILFIIMYATFETNCICVWLTGMPCPGCGLTRAGMAILQLEFVQAWEIHPFIYPIGIYVVVVLLYRYILNKKWKYLNIYGIIIGITMCVYYLYRMMNGFPTEEPVNYQQHNLFTELIIWFQTLV